MPYTLSHAAAVLPFRRVGLLLSAFVAGTFAPDFEYFLLLEPMTRYGHQWPGVLYFTLPAAIAALWIFHRFVKRPGSTLLPRAVEERVQPYLTPFPFGGPLRFLHIVLSATAGILSHLLWDSFTHYESWACRLWPHLLLHHVPLDRFGVHRVYEFLQYFSTLTGLAALALWFLLWFRSASPVAVETGPGLRGRQRRAIVSLMAVSSFAVALLRTYIAIPVVGHHNARARFVIALVVGTGSMFTIELLAYCTWWNCTRTPEGAAGAQEA
jgi:hypothetical protein